MRDGHGPGPEAPGPWPSAQDMVHTWRINFILNMNLWNPKYCQLSIILDMLYIGDYQSI